MRLAEWDAQPIHLPYRRAVQWASSREDGADYLLLRLVGDDGTIGLAEGLAKTAWQGVTPQSLASSLEELFIPELRDLDLLDENALSRALAGIPGPRLARSLVETACWDLRSQARGMPFWQIRGGGRCASRAAKFASRTRPGSRAGLIGSGSRLSNPDPGSNGPGAYCSSQRSMFQVIRPVVRYGTRGVTFLTDDR
jgi:L-alanine-DL-glutamate epimerase-like enolase superfamily enzyme